MISSPNPSATAGRDRPAPRRAFGRACVALGALALLATPAAAASAATPSTRVVHVSISSEHIWTSTAIQLHAGDTVAITASGRIHFGPAPIDHVGPAGLPGGSCGTGGPETRKAFAAPELICWSLIGRIGTSAPFQVGTHTKLRAPAAGPLWLGVNDNRLPDNLGAWSVAIALTASAAAKHSGTSNGLVFLAALAILVLLVLALFIALSRRARRRRRGAATAPEPPAAPVEVPIPVAVAEPAASASTVTSTEFVAAPVPAAPIANRPVEESVEPTAGGFIETNIFQVELTNGIDLAVGYNYFPDGIDLHWSVRQGSIFTTGQFVTSGGGKLYHFVTVPLGVKLVGGIAVDVEFTWSIGGVPFRYSVRRDPGC